MPESIFVTGGFGPPMLTPPVNPQAQRPQSDVSRAERAPQSQQQSAGAAGMAQVNVPQDNLLKKIDEAKDRAQHKDEKPMTLEEATESLQEYLNKLPSDLQFSIDADSSRHFFKIVNPITREVVRQFPSDEFLSMVKRLREISADADAGANGVFLDDKT